MLYCVLIPHSLPTVSTASTGAARPVSEAKHMRHTADSTAMVVPPNLQRLRIMFHTLDAACLGVLTFHVATGAAEGVPPYVFLV